MTDVDPAERLNLISRQGLCIGCGLCQEIAGPDRVRCTVTPNGYERPVIVGHLDHETVDRIYDVCPAVRVDGLPDRLIDDATTIDPVWGPLRRIVRAWATDPDVRFQGSTGGVLTALGVHLFDTGKVDAILHVGPSTTHPTHGESRISRSADDVRACVGSRYGPTAALVRLEEALASADRLAVIAKPCDLSALRNLARTDPRIDRQIRYWLTLVCGGFLPPQSMNQFLAKQSIQLSEVSALRYRGHGCPGPTRIETRDGRVIEKTYLELWGDDETAWHLPYRCKICPDGIGESADIAAADTWPGGSPTPAMLEDDLGTNAVLARTVTGARLLADAEADGHLVIEREATVDELTDWQPHQVAKKKAAWARLAGRRRAGALTLESAGLRLRELARAQPVGALLDQGRGSIVRVRDGRADEDVPVAADG